MAQVEFRFDVKPASFLADNPDLVLADGEPIFLEDGSYAFGDNSTTLENLTFFSPGQGGTRLISGGAIAVVTDDVTVAEATYSIEGEGTFTAPEIAFNDIALSAAGNVRYVGFFGKNDSTIIKVEGTEGASATYPTSAGNCPIGFVLVTDAGVGSGETPAEVDFADIGGNASDNASLVSYVANNKYTVMVHSHVSGFNPADATYYYFGQPNIDTTVGSFNANGLREVGFPVTGTIRAAIITVGCSNATSVNSTANGLYLRNTTSGVNHTITTNLTFNHTDRQKVTLVTGLSIAVTQGDRAHSVMGDATWPSVNPTGVFLHIQYIIY